MSHSPEGLNTCLRFGGRSPAFRHRSIAFYETALKPLGIVHAIVFDSDGYSLEAVYKSWQHRQS